MSEIFISSLEFMDRERAMEETVATVLDESRFTTEEMIIKLTALEEIAERESMMDIYQAAAETGLFKEK